MGGPGVVDQVHSCIFFGFCSMLLDNAGYQSLKSWLFVKWDCLFFAVPTVYTLLFKTSLNSNTALCG